MEPNRVFTDEELRLAGLRSVDALAEALEAGDPTAALGFARRLKGEVRSMNSAVPGLRKDRSSVSTPPPGPEPKRRIQNSINFQLL